MGDEHCLLNDMRRGYQVLLNIIKFMEWKNGEKGVQHRHLCEADHSAGWPMQDQLKQDPPMKDLHAQSQLPQGPRVQVLLMHEQFAQDQATQELPAQEPPIQEPFKHESAKQDPAKQETVKQKTVKQETITAKPFSSFQALPRTRKSLPAKPEQRHNVRQQKNSTLIVRSRLCKNVFLGKSPFHPRHPAKVESDGWDADLSDNPSHHMNQSDDGKDVDFPYKVSQRRVSRSSTLEDTVSTTDAISFDANISDSDVVIEADHHVPRVLRHQFR